MPSKYFVPALAAAGLVTFAAMGYSQPHEKGASKGSGVTKAIAVMHPTKGQKVEGTVTFTKVANGVRVEAHIHGLAAGNHGFHIHEFGDCSSPEGMSTGGHFNPEKADHAGPKTHKRHIGDLGNIEADNSGHAKYDMVDDQLRFDGPTSIIGRGLIIHEKADDFKTQPTGNAGGRVSCGVIGVAKGS